MIDTAEVEAFDRRTVAELKQAQRRIEDGGRLAGLKIARVRTYRVLMPWTGTKRWDGSAEGFTFAEFETDKGPVGVAEGVSDDQEDLNERLVGRDPFDPAVRADMGLAYWDLAAKVAGKPLWRHLRDVCGVEAPTVERVPTAAYTWHRFPDVNGEHEVTAENYPRHVLDLVDEYGFRVVKLSMCDYEPWRYAELVQRIRQAAGPELEIRVDPHASWSESQALHFMRQVEDCRLEWIEEPVGGRFANIYRAGHRLRQLSSVPVSSHAWLPPLARRPSAPGRYSDAALDIPLDLDAMRRWAPADVSAPDAYDGPLALKRYYDVARFCGMDIGMHSAYELGPATAVRLHIAAFAFPYEIPYHIVWGGAVAPFSSHALDAHYNQWAGDVIRGGKMRYDQGFLPVPSGPGLGVELDPEALEHYAWSPEKAAVHTRHIESIRARRLDALDWNTGRDGWPRYRG